MTLAVTHAGGQCRAWLLQRNESRERLVVQENCNCCHKPTFPGLHMSSFTFLTINCFHSWHQSCESSVLYGHLWQSNFVRSTKILVDQSIGCSVFSCSPKKMIVQFDIFLLQEKQHVPDMHKSRVHMGTWMLGATGKVSSAATAVHESVLRVQSSLTKKYTGDAARTTNQTSVRYF